MSKRLATLFFILTSLPFVSGYAQSHSDPYDGIPFAPARGSHKITNPPTPSIKPSRNNGTTSSSSHYSSRTVELSEARRTPPSAREQRRAERQARREMRQQQDEMRRRAEQANRRQEEIRRQQEQAQRAQEQIYQRTYTTAPRYDRRSSRYARDERSSQPRNQHYYTNTQQLHTQVTEAYNQVSQQTPQKKKAKNKLKSVHDKYKDFIKYYRRIQGDSSQFRFDYDDLKKDYDKLRRAHSRFQDKLQDYQKEFQKDPAYIAEQERQAQKDLAEQEEAKKIEEKRLQVSSCNTPDQFDPVDEHTPTGFLCYKHITLSLNAILLEALNPKGHNYKKVYLAGGTLYPERDFRDRESSQYCMVERVKWNDYATTNLSSEDNYEKQYLLGQSRIMPRIFSGSKNSYARVAVTFYSDPEKEFAWTNGALKSQAKLKIECVSSKQYCSSCNGHNGDISYNSINLNTMKEYIFGDYIHIELHPDAHYGPYWKENYNRPRYAPKKTTSAPRRTPTPTSEPKEDAVWIGFDEDE